MEWLYSFWSRRPVPQGILRSNLIILVPRVLGEQLRFHFLLPQMAQGSQNYTPSCQWLVTWYALCALTYPCAILFTASFHHSAALPKRQTSIEDTNRECRNSIIQPPLPPTLGGYLKLGDTPRPSAGSILHLFFGSLKSLNRAMWTYCLTFQ